MAIVSKSLHHSNIAFLLDSTKYVEPENAAFAGLFTGAMGKGARFTDDPVLRAKVLTLPALGLRITLEAGGERPRLRIDDETQAEPDKSSLTGYAIHALRNLFPQTPFVAYGFNYDIFFKTRDVVPIEDIFEEYFDEEAASGADLRDVGIQFTLDKKKSLEVWFVKVVSPMEVAVHLNNHFPTGHLPAATELQSAFIKCYDDSTATMEKFRYGR